MNKGLPSPSTERGKYAAGVIGGVGAGLLFCTVLYRHFSVSDLTDPLRLIGFALLFGGVFFSHRKSL